VLAYQVILEKRLLNGCLFLLLVTRLNHHTTGGNNRNMYKTYSLTSNSCHFHTFKCHALCLYATVFCESERGLNYYHEELVSVGVFQLLVEHVQQEKFTPAVLKQLHLITDLHTTHTTNSRRTAHL